MNAVTYKARGTDQRESKGVTTEIQGKVASDERQQEKLEVAKR